MDPKDIAKFVSTDPWYPELDVLEEDTNESVEGETQWYIDLSGDRIGIFPVMEGVGVAFGEGKFNFPRGPYNTIEEASGNIDKLVEELNILEDFASSVGSAVASQPETPPLPHPDGEEDNPQLDDLSQMWDKIGKSLIDARTVAEQANVQSSNIASAAMVRALTQLIKNYNELENPYNTLPDSGAERKIG
jgi:hypothetical protein